MKKLESLKSAKFNKLSNVELAKVNGGLKEHSCVTTTPSYDGKVYDAGWDDSVA